MKRRSRSRSRITTSRLRVGSSRQTMNAKVLAVIGGVVALLVLLVVVGGGDDSSEEARLSSNQWGEVASDDQLFLIEAIDFECPGCAGAHPLMEHLRNEYGDRVVFVARHYPLRAIHLNAGYAHRAAEAAAKQGKFWEMHDLLFEQRDLWVNQRDLRVNPAPAIRQFAEEIGLDLEQFELDHGSAEVNDIINNDIDWVNQHTSERKTPTFFVQRGVDGPVEVVPTTEIQTLDQATALLDSWLAEIPDPAETAESDGNLPADQADPDEAGEPVADNT